MSPGIVVTVVVLAVVAAVVAGTVWLILTMADAWQQNAQDVLNSERRSSREGGSRPGPPDDELR